MGLFQKAMPCDQKLKILIDGISGTGKTVSALRLATGIASIEKSRIAVITSEPKATSWYSKDFDFDMAAITNCAVINFTKLVREALNAGYRIIIIDSLTDAYDGINGYLQQAENIGKDPKKSGLNKWATPTEHWNALIKLIVSCDAHVICTAKQKTEYVQDRVENGNGKTMTKIQRLGDKVILKDRTEFDFDFHISLDTNHTATFNKVRHDKYDKMRITYMSEETGIQLLNDANNLQQTFAIQRVAFSEIVNDEGLQEDIEKAPDMELVNNDYKKYNVDMQLDETPETAKPVAKPEAKPSDTKPATIPIKKPNVSYLSKEEGEELVAIATATGYSRDQVKAVLNKHNIVYLSKIPTDTKPILEKIFRDKGYLIGM